MDSLNVRVLVVDDDDDFRAVMVTHLRRYGCEVEQAENGHKALEMLRAGPPYAILVSDLMMPGMTGLELIGQARALDPDLQMIIITAAGTLESAIAAMREHGAYDYLLKPLETTQELSLAVQRAAEYRELHIERELLRASLEQAATQLATILANAGDAILAADAQGNLTVVNPAAYPLFANKDVLGEPAAETLPAPVARTVSNWQMRGDGGLAVVELNWPEGSTQRVSLAPMPTPQGVGWVMTLQDISHVKQLNAIKTRLLNEAIGKIRVPLAHGFSNLAELSELVRADGQRHSDLTYNLVKLLGKIQKWADDVLALSRIEAGEGLQFENLDLCELVRSWLPALPEATPNHDIRFRFDLPSERTEMYTDANLIQRLLQEMVNFVLRDGSRASEVEIGLQSDDEQVWLDVRVAGLEAARAGANLQTGLSSLDRVENRQAHDLAMIHAIVGRLRGQVWVREPQPRGNAISVCLPLGMRVNIESSAATETVALQT